MMTGWGVTRNISCYAVQTVNYFQYQHILKSFTSRIQQQCADILFSLNYKKKMYIPIYGYIHPSSIIPLSIPLTCQGCSKAKANPSWLRIRERWRAINTYINTNGQLRVASWTNLHSFGLQEETGAPGGIPHRHRKNIQTPYRQPANSNLEPRQFLLCNNVINQSYTAQCIKSCVCKSKALVNVLTSNSRMGGLNIEYPGVFIHNSMVEKIKTYRE